jgi:hypothetical protein
MQVGHNNSYKSSLNYYKEKITVVW